MLQLLTWTATGLVAGGLARTLMRAVATSDSPAVFVY